MSGAHDAAQESMHALLAELPWFFSENPDEYESNMSEFRVIKKRNVRKVHRALYELQEYLGMTE